MDAVAYKGGVCVDCGDVLEYFLYDFHHLDPKTKEFDWNKLKMKSDANIRKELDKCVLLCCKCHRIREQKYKMKLVALQGIEPCSPV